MFEAGILDENVAVELIDGELIQRRLTSSRQKRHFVDSSRCTI